MSTELAQNIAHAGLRAPATSGATSVSVELITGAWPTVPFSALMEDGTSRKEQVTVTGVSGNTLTVTRAQGGTSAVAHDTMSSVDVITTPADLAVLETFLSGDSVAVHVAAADPHTGYVLDAGLAAHEADSTAVHGITDTSALALTSALTAHDIDTTAVHGVTDTAQLAVKNATNVFSAAQTIANNTALQWKDSGGTARRTQLMTGGNALYFGDIDNALAAASLLLMAGGTGYIEFNTNGTRRGYILDTGAWGIETNFGIVTAGKGLQVKEGSNAKQGVSTLVGGTVVVSNTSVTASSRIFLTVQSLGTVAAPKTVAVTARTASTSFTITSEDATDTSVVAWEIFEPA